MTVSLIVQLAFSYKNVSSSFCLLSRATAGSTRLCSAECNSTFCLIYRTFSTTHESVVLTLYNKCHNWASRLRIAPFKRLMSDFTPTDAAVKKHLQPSKDSVAQCCRLFCCSDTQNPGQIVLQIVRQQGQRPSREASLSVLRSRRVLSGNSCCVTHGHPSLPWHGQNHSKMRISLVPLHRRFISGGQLPEKKH